MGTNINCYNSETKQTPLHLAVIGGHLSLCDLLIQNGADLNSVDSNQWTPLHHAAHLDKVSCVILLIRRGVKLTPADAEGKVCIFLFFYFVSYSLIFIFAI